MKFSTILKAFLVLAFLALSACGSSGPARAPAPFNPAPAPPPPPPPPPQSPLPPIPNSPFNTPEFRFSYALQAINPIPAYDLGATGQGTIVAVIDGPFDSTHKDLVTAYTATSIDLISGAGRGTLDGPDNHGAQVAAVIAARKNNSGMHGVAFTAQIMAIRVDSLNSCAEGDCSYFVSDIADGILYAVANGAKVINISLGGDSITQALLDAFAVARDAGVFIVMSAGNEEMADPNVFAQTIALPQFLGFGLIVGAVDQNLDLASFSNRGGDSRQAFLVAPGVNVGTVNFNDLYARVSGTSFSAPYVAGAAAILIGMFPNLDAADLFQILTQSATNLGPAGVDPRFGHGLLNIGRAIQPLGAMAFATATMEGDEAGDVPSDGSGFGFSIAFGDALYNIEGFSKVMILDGFRRSYFIDARAKIGPLFTPSFSLLDAIDSQRNTQSLFVPLARGEGFSLSLVDQNWRARPFQEALPMGIQSSMTESRPYLYFDTKVTSRMAVGIGYGFNPGLTLDRMAGGSILNRDFLAVRFDGTPHLALAEGTKTFNASRKISSKTTTVIGTAAGVYDFSRQLPFAKGMPEARALSSYIRVNHREGRFSLSMTAGFLKEDNAILGSISAGALSLGSGAETSFIGARGKIDLGRGFEFAGEYTAGWTSVENAVQTFILDVTKFRTSSFSAALIKTGLFKKNDRIGVAVYQPLRVENGALALSLPTGRDFGLDQILFTNSSAGLAPSSRQVNVEVSYRVGILKGFLLEANYIHQFNPGHSIALDHADAVLVRLRKAY